MFSLIRWVALALATSAWLQADETLTHARNAQARLGPDVWSTVIEIENDAPRSRYPARFHALVFEVSGLLWFYTSVDGTQSFSLHRGRLAEEKADFGPLLRDIEPGLVRWRHLERAWAAEPEPLPTPLPNGCFVESVAAWLDRLRTGEDLSEPRLFSYYVETRSGRMGHTVLTYVLEGRLEVFDALVGRTRSFSPALRENAEKLGRIVSGMTVAKARWLPLDLAVVG